MPYISISELPDSIKSSLPAGAQKVWMHVFNNAMSKEGTKEGDAFAIAWSAVKNGWEKKEDEWIRKNAMSRTHSTAGCVEFTKQGKLLEFEAIGFAPGTWHGIDNHPTEYTRELVAANAEKFAMKRLKSMRLSIHGKTDKDVVGWVTTQRLLADGLIAVGGYVFDQEEIEYLETRRLAGQDIGISPEFLAPSTYDPLTKIYKAYALDVTGYSFVGNPACTVCYVGDSRLLSEKEKKKDMSNTGGGIPVELTKEQVEELKTFYNSQLTEGKTFEEIKKGLVVVPPVPVKPTEPVVAEVVPEPLATAVATPPAVIPGATAPAAIPAALDEASQLRLNEAIEAVGKIDKWEMTQRLLAATGVEKLVGEIKEMDATFDSERMLAHFGDDPYVKTAFLKDYMAQRKHDIESIPELERQLTGAVEDDKMKEFAKDFGVEYVAGMTQDDLVTKAAEALV